MLKQTRTKKWRQKNLCKNKDNFPHTIEMGQGDFVEKYKVI